MSNLLLILMLIVAYVALAHLDGNDKHLLS